MRANFSIADWLRGLGLTQYETVFRDNAIDIETLPELGETDLEKLGVLLGHRKKMLKAIAAPDAEAPAPNVPTGRADDATPRIAVAERRQLTIMFCDLVASTALSTRLDPEDMREILAAYTERASAVVTRFGGFVAQFVGDGILIYFGYPQAQEDDPERALRAALALVDTIGSLEFSTGPLQLRIGIATGLVVVGDLADGGSGQTHEIVGETPNLGARLQALAEPNTVIVAPSTRQLVGDLFEFRDLGHVPLKGFADPVQVWGLVRESAVHSRFEALRTAALTPLFGREDDLATLSRRWAQAQDGEGQIVLISGEPGIGKSRLIAAFEEKLRGEAHVRLRCFCSPQHQNSMFYPAIAQLERAARLERNDTPETKLDKLKNLLSQSGETSADTVALFAELLDLPTGERELAASPDPQSKRELTLSALVRQLEGQARQKPVFLVFEDVHWIDASTLELLDIIAAGVPQLPVLLCVTFRPEFQPPWTGQAHVTVLALSRLYRRDAAMIVARVAGNKRLPSEIVDRITERADGVPLFAEELTKALLEGGLLREHEGGYVLAGPLPPLAIPTSLHASLMARLDRLSAVKEVAQIGAALGRQFSYELLAAVAPQPDTQLRDALDRLAAADLINVRGLPPNAVVIFKHALVQDTAYGTLLRGKRQELHSRIAAVLEQRFPETVTAQPEILAHHYTQAGLIDRAIEYWRRAGERALRRSANVEGVRHLTRGLELLMSLPAGRERDRREFALRLALGPAVRALKGNGADEVWEVFSRARDLMDGSATVKEEMIVLHGLWSVHNMRAELPAARRLAEHCLALAAEGTDPQAPAMANLLMGHNLWGMGLFSEARPYLERTLDYCAPGKDPSKTLRFSFNLGVAGMSFLALTLWPLGYPDQAVAVAEEAEDFARGTGHVPLIALVAYCNAFLSGLLGADPARALARSDEAMAYCVEHGISAYEPWARFCRGAAVARRGEPRSGIEIMREALAAAERAKAGFLRPIHLGHLALASAGIEEHEVGLELLNQALQIVADTEERSYEAELYRLRGEALLASGNARDGEADLERALQVARRQHARLWELRAAASLARHWRGHSKAAEARALLAPVYGWFTQGFDTADLEQARALIDELQ